MSGFVDLGPITDWAPGGQRNVVAGTNPLLLCHEAASGRLWAMASQCPHAFQPLEGGVVQGGTIQCPKHGACFDLATGQPTNAVTARPLRVYATRIHDDHLFVSTVPMPTFASP